MEHTLEKKAWKVPFWWAAVSLSRLPPLCVPTLVCTFALNDLSPLVSFSVYLFIVLITLPLA